MTTKPIELLKLQLAAYEKQVLPDLLSKHGISPQQFVQVVLSEIKKNEKLLQAFQDNPSSMFASILAGAEVGLIPSDMLGEFYLIPRMIKNKMTVTPLIGYKGMVAILLRTGEITRIHTEVVYDCDIFEPTYGLEPSIKHIPVFEKPRKAANIKAAYAVAKNKSGEYNFCVVTRQEIEGVKAMSRYDNELYFNDAKNPNRWMEKKVALSQLSKMLPKDYYSKKAISMDAMVEGGALLQLDDNNQIRIVENTPIRPTRFRNIYGTINANPPTPLSNLESSIEAQK